MQRIIEKGILTKAHLGVGTVRHRVRWNWCRAVGSGFLVLAGFGVSAATMEPSEMVFPETAPMSVQITTTELTAVERVQKDEKEEKDEQAPAVQETPDTETPMPAGQAMDGVADKPEKTAEKEAEPGEASPGTPLEATVQAQAKNFGTTDPGMLAAIAKARATLDDFLALAEAPMPDTKNFKLKVRFREGKNLEYFWIIPFKRVDDGFEGLLGNKPEVLKNLDYEQIVHFSRADVVDWGYLRDGRQVGSYTVCETFKRMPKSVVDYFREYNGFDC